MKTTKEIFRVISVLSLFALFLAINPTLLMAQSNDSATITNLLSQAKNLATQAEEHADTLKSYTTSGLSWESHASQLSAMREHVNDLGKVVSQLNDARAEGSPWQQEAIDRINPLLREMADHLTATINHLNDHKNQLQMQAYRDYTSANYDLASRTATVISDLVEYGKAKSKATSLEQKLEPPTTGAGF